MLGSGSSAMLSSLTWCPVCASRTTLPPVQISFSICCPFLWWRPRVFPFLEVGHWCNPGHLCVAKPCLFLYKFRQPWLSFVYLPDKRQVLTKVLSPFDDSVDKNPVVRSVVLKLLLKYRWGTMVEHCIRPTKCASNIFSGVSHIFLNWTVSEASMKLKVTYSSICWQLNRATSWRRQTKLNSTCCTSTAWRYT